MAEYTVAHAGIFCWLFQMRAFVSKVNSIKEVGVYVCLKHMEIKCSNLVLKKFIWIKIEPVKQTKLLQRF